MMLTRCRLNVAVQMKGTQMVDRFNRDSPAQANVQLQAAVIDGLHVLVITADDIEVITPWSNVVEARREPPVLEPEKHGKDKAKLSRPR